MRLGMQGDPMAAVPPSRHPFQIWVLVACILSGITTVGDWGRPGTLNEILPEYMMMLWGWVLLLAGGLGIAAAFWKDRITGLLIERIALGGLGGILVVYGVAARIVGGSSATVIMIMCASLGAASFWRIHHVHRDLRRLHRWIEAHYDNGGDASA